MWRLLFSFICIEAVICYHVPERKEKVAVPSVELLDGNSMPRLGFGTWLGMKDLIPGDDKLPELIPPTSDSIQRAVEAAIDVGFRSFDTAAVYMIEDQVGRAIHNKMAEGVVTREDLFITTKLWNDRHATEDVVPALRESLARLNLDYVDLYLIHFPFSLSPDLNITNIDYLDTWKGMVEAKELGLAKSIGVANFNQPQLGRLMRHSEVKPAVLQNEVNLNIQQDCLREYAKKHGIVIMGYTPFGSLFPSKATPMSPPPRIDTPELVAMAKKYGKTVPQINLRYLYELDVVPIPKSEGRNHIQENFDILDFHLEEADKDFLKDYDRNFRSLDVGLWKKSPNYPF